MKIVTIPNISELKESTFTALNLAYILAENKHRTLLIDWNTNQHLTNILTDDDTLNHIIKEFFNRDFDINSAIKKSKHNKIQFLPSSLEAFTVTADYNYNILYNKLKKVEDKYDYCILDCNFSHNLNSLKMAFAAADYVLVPITDDQRIPEYLDIVKKIIDDIYLDCKHKIDYKLFIYETFGKLPYKKVLQFLKNIEDDKILNTFLPHYTYEETLEKNDVSLNEYLVICKLEGSYIKLSEEFLGIKI